MFTQPFCNILSKVRKFPSHYKRFFRNINLYYMWCGFRTISLAKSVTSYTEYLMYFFHCEETRHVVLFLFLKKYWRYVSIFKYIDAMLLNLDPDSVRSGPRLHSTCLKQFSSFDVLIFYFQWHE